MTYWARHHNFNNLIRDLNSQTYKDFDLFIWNNNKSMGDSLNIKKEDLNGYSLYVHNNEKNIYGFGRFILANKLLTNKIDNFSGEDYDKIMFFDDDERLYSDCLSFFSINYQKQNYKGHWAFKIFSTYQDRQRCKFGEEANYIGTGGCVLDPYVFSNMDFIKSVPEKFYCVEDIALTLYCKKIGYKTTGLGKITPKLLEFIKDENRLFSKLKYKYKNEAYEVLRNKYGVK